jgi:hypothetical protein
MDANIKGTNESWAHQQANNTARKVLLVKLIPNSVSATATRRIAATHNPHPTRIVRRLAIASSLGFIPSGVRMGQSAGSRS